MARRRMIDPNIWSSEDMSKLTFRQRLLVIGLFSNADDHGKGKAKSTYIRSTIFPYDDIHIHEIIDDIETVKAVITIRFYEVEGNSYYKFLNWAKWQRVDKPQPSIIPEPVENHSGIIPEPFLPKGKEEKGKEEKSGHNNHSDLFLKQINTLNIKMRGAYELDEVTAYIGIMEAAIISEAIKRSEGKNGAYILSILKDWHSKGYSKLDDVKTKPERSERPPQPNRLSLIPLYEVTDEDRRKEKERDDRLRSRNQSPTGTS